MHNDQQFESNDQQFNQPFNPQSGQTLSQVAEPPPDGPPAMSGPVRESYDLNEQEQPQGPGKILIGVGVACLVLVCFGVVKSIFFSAPSEPKPRRQVQSVWSEQQAMMREALDMAREAQAMQRERMDQMNRAMYDAEFGYYEDEGN